MPRPAAATVGTGTEFAQEIDRPEGQPAAVAVGVDGASTCLVTSGEGGPTSAVLLRAA